MTIQYSLLLDYIPGLKRLFIHPFIFGIFFAVTYIPVAIFIGWRDFKKGSVSAEQTLLIKSNPWTQDLAMALILMSEGKTEEVKQILRKWTEKL